MLALFRLFSLAYLRRHPLRASLTVLGIALGIAAVVAMALANASVLASVRRTTEEVAGRARLVVFGDRTGVPSSLAERVRRIKGVQRATLVIRQSAVLKAVAGRPAGGRLQIFAVDALHPGSVPGLRFQSQDLGPATVALRLPQTIVVTRAFAKRLGVVLEDSAPATITLATARGPATLRVGALLGIAGPEHPFGDRVAVVPMAQAQELFGKGTNVDEIQVALAQEVTARRRERIRESIQTTVGTGFAVERPRNRGRQAERLAGAWRSGMLLLSAIALFVGMFLVFNTAAVGVTQRRGEIGILRALGTSRSQVGGVVVFEALLLGAIGSVVGVVVGVGLARGLLYFWAPTLASSELPGVLVRLDVPLLALGLGLALGPLCAALAALWPAWEATRVTPLEATRPSFGESGRRRTVRTAAIGGVGCLALAFAGILHPVSRVSTPIAFGTATALLLGFVLLCPLLTPLVVRLLVPLARRGLGAVGRIASEHLLRAPGRATVTVAAMVVGFALAISSATIAASFQRSMFRYLERVAPADLVVTRTPSLFTPTALPLAHRVGEALRADPDVAEVQSLRVVRVPVGPRRADLLVLDVAAWSRRAGFSLLRGDARAVTQGLARGEGVVVSESFAHRLGYRGGEQLTLRTPRGATSFPILGVFADYSSSTALIGMDRGLFQRYWDDRLADALHAFVRPGRDPEKVRDRLAASFGRRFDTFVLSQAQFKKRVGQQLESTLLLVHLQEGLALVVALLGLLNTLLIAVLERTREIGVLRAVGASRAQIAAMVLVEALLLCLTGACLGVLLGAALSWVSVEILSLVHSGWRVEYQFDAAVPGLLIGLSLAAATVAAWLPARRAARLPVTVALTHE